jgi:choline dehydrogenase-like flavoprotein
MAYLALATPGLGRFLAPEAIRARKLGGDRTRVSRHLRNVIADLPASASYGTRFLRLRYASKVRLPGFFVRNAARRHAFHYHAEQAPNTSSRVRLGEARDALGQRRLIVEPRFARDDAQSVVATHALMDERLRASGLGQLTHKFADDERVDAVLAQAGDGFHQIGTARMSDDPRRGVVDPNTRVHGIDNLYLAGSAIFPSSSQANPTLTAVALAARLAAHLTDRLRTNLVAPSVGEKRLELLN